MNGTAVRSGVVAVGVVCNGVGTVATLGVASRLFSVDDFAIFATWWIVATLVAFPLGVFESLLTRQVVTDLVAGASIRSGTGAVATRAALLVVPAGIGLAIAAPIVGDVLFDGSGGLAVVLAAFVMTSFVQALERGHAAGIDRFGLVSVLLSIDGALRALALVVCLVLDLTSPISAALVILVGSVLTALIGHVALLGWIGRPNGRTTSFTSATTLLLLAGAIGPMLINNASVPWLSGHGAAGTVVGSFSGALALSRVPIQLGGAAFGPLLRRFAHALDVGDISGEKSEFRGALILAVVTSAFFVTAFTGLANPIISVYLGPAYHLPVWVYALLGASSGAMMVAIVAQVRAAARQRWQSIAFIWLVAACVFMVVVLGPGSILLRCSVAPAAASFTGLIALLLSGRSRTSTSHLTAAL